MDSQFKWLVLIEVIIILSVILIKYLYHLIEERKINKILKFFKKKLNKNKTDKFEECLEIIRKNQEELNKRYEIKEHYSGKYNPDNKYKYISKEGEDNND